jgi:general secretion pathway protein K
MRLRFRYGAGQGEEGFVLVVVMGLLFVVSAVAATFMLAARSQIRVEMALGTRAELESMADGLARLTAFRLASQRQSDAGAGRFAVDGTPERCRFEGMTAEIRVNDVAGLIDINSASADILQMLLQGLGIEEARAARIAAAIQDFRDPDDIRGQDGAEAADYQTAGLSHGPKNAPFDSVGELDQVLGITPELLERLRPFVTVHSRSPILDLSVSPLPLLQALARGNNAKAAWGTIVEPATREAFQPPAALLTRFNPRSMSKTRARMFAIDVDISGPRGGRYRRHAVVELTAQASRGFAVRDWSSLARETAARSAPPQEDHPCLEFE